MSTAFDVLIDTFATSLATAPAVCSFIDTDIYAEPLPAGRTESIVITSDTAEPQPLGLLTGNPVDWVTQIHVKCLASANAVSPRPAANALAGAAYARLAADPSLGLDGVFIGEPTLAWAFDQAATRLAACTLIYSVHHRTTGLTLA